LPSGATAAGVAVDGCKESSRAGFHLDIQICLRMPELRMPELRMPGLRGELKMADRLFLKSAACIVTCLLAISVAFAGEAPVPEPVADQETELGKAVYEQLRDKVEIVQSSPLYETLKPIADAISRVAQPRYEHPFKFYLVHEAQPNAFATPGGNVYVVDSLLYFVKKHRAARGHALPRSLAHDSS
jgi:hypothetical protein